MKDPKTRLRELLETMPLEAQQKKRALEGLEELSPENVEMALELLESAKAGLYRFPQLFKEACEAQRRAREADPRTKLRALLKTIPFGADQRDMMGHNIEGMSRERAEELLKLWEKAGESAKRALGAADGYKKKRETPRRKKSNRDR